MKEVLEQALAEMIVKATAGVEKSGSFIIGEMPEVAQQLLMFTTASTGVRLALCVLFIAMWFRVVTKKYNEGCAAREEYNDGKENQYLTTTYLWQDNSKDEAFWAGSIISGIVAGILFLCSIALSITLLKLTLVPKVWLIEYAAKLVGS